MNETPVHPTDIPCDIPIDGWGVQRIRGHAALCICRSWGQLADCMFTQFTDASCFISCTDNQKNSDLFHEMYHCANMHNYTYTYFISLDKVTFTYTYMTGPVPKCISRLQLLFCINEDNAWIHWELRVYAREVDYIYTYNRSYSAVGVFRIKCSLTLNRHNCHSHGIWVKFLHHALNTCCSLYCTHRLAVYLGYSSAVQCIKRLCELSNFPSLLLCSIIVDPFLWYNPLSK